MSLPKIVAPEHSVKLFSIPKPVKFRPFLVKEEKLLLIAQQGLDPVEVKAAVEQLITNCTYGSLNAATLPSFDFEMLFLQLRARSVNNLIEVNFTCQNKVSRAKRVPGKEPNDPAIETVVEEKCGANVPVSINIDDIKLTVPEGHTNKIWLDDTLGVIMKYPNAETFELLEKDESELITPVLQKCIGSIFDKSGAVYEVQEQTTEEVLEFITSLSIPQIEKIREFFTTMPKLTHTFRFVCPKCQYEEDYTLSGLMDFFD